MVVEPEGLVVKDRMRDGSAATKSRMEIMKTCLKDAVLNGQRMYCYPRSSQR